MAEHNVLKGGKTFTALIRGIAYAEDAMTSFEREADKLHAIEEDRVRDLYLVYRVLTEDKNFLTRDFFANENNIQSLLADLARTTPSNWPPTGSEKIHPTSGSTG